MYINGASSTKSPLSCGVPLGSVLGSKLFKMYILALAEIPKHCGIPYHFYADDDQLYIVFDLPTDDNHHTVILAIKGIEACVNEMRLWLAIYMLLCNDDKTELMLFASRHEEPIDFPGLQIGSEDIIPGQIARNQLSLPIELKIVESSGYTMRKLLYLRIPVYLQKSCLLTLL